MDRIYNAERPYFYVAQDNLELVTDPFDCLVSHPSLREYFLGLDGTGKRYIPKHKLAYCMRTGLEAEGVGAASVVHVPADSSSTSGAAAADTAAVSRAYEDIDRIVVECYSILKRSFNTSRVNYITASHAASLVADAPAVAVPSTITDSDSDSTKAPQVDVDDSSVLDVSDLYPLMKHAVTREDALTLESALWRVWMSHSDPDISKALRLGVAHTQRGNFLKAMDAYTIASTLDPTFSEAHNKLAALHQQLKEYDNCLLRATQALSLFPNHFGALSGMALAYEKMGE